MIRFFENLKSAPDETKKTFAVLVSAICTVVIVVLSLTISNPLTVTAEKEEEKDKLASPFAALSSGISESFNNFKSELSNIPIKDVLFSVFRGDMIATTTPQDAAPEKHATSTSATSSESAMMSEAMPPVATPVKTPETPKADLAAKKMNAERSLPPIPAKKEEAKMYGPFLTSDMIAQKMAAAAILTVRSAPEEIKPETKVEIIEPIPVVEIAETATTAPTVSKEKDQGTVPNHPEWPKTFTSGMSN
jgi:hypothetical protein